GDLRNYSDQMSHLAHKTVTPPAYRRLDIAASVLIESREKATAHWHNRALMQGSANVANRNNLKPVQKLDRFRKQPSTEQLTRFGDVVIAAICLVIMAPMLLLVAIAIKLESPGPVFERQSRVGRRGRFDKLEFRTTVYDPQKLTTMWTARLTSGGEHLH